jgi:hypothetical protein
MALKYQVSITGFYNFGILGLGGKIFKPKARHVSLKAQGPKTYIAQ